MVEAIKTWDDIRSFDDIVVEGEKQIISRLESETRPKCPYLKKDGKTFCYCGKDMPKSNDRTIGPLNPIYRRHVDALELQMHCMDDFGTCCFYSGKLKR